MAKKNKSKPYKSSIFHNPISISAHVIDTQDVLKGKANERISEYDWSGLKELSTSISPDLYPEVERVQIKTLKLRFMVRAITHVGMLQYVGPPDDKELKETLIEFKSLGTLHQNPFDLVQYCKTAGRGIEQLTESVLLLKKAIKETKFFPLYVEFRHYALLLKRNIEYPEDFEEPRLNSTTPNILTIMDDTYAVLQLAATSSEDQLTLQVLNLEKQSIFADPWDLNLTLDEIRSLPEPTIEEIQTYIGSNDDTEYRNQLTPMAWAFLLEFGVCHADEKSLVASHKPDFSYLPAQAIKRILQSITGDVDYSEAHLSAGLVDLMTFTRISQLHRDPKSLCTKLEMRVTHVGFGDYQIHCPDITDTLLCALEHTCTNFKGYRFENELLCLCRVLRADSNFGVLSDDEGEEDDEKTPGLTWLCSANLDFQLLAFTVLNGCAPRLLLLLDAIQRASTQEITVEITNFDVYLEVEEFDKSRLPQLISSLISLANSRATMGEWAIRVWRGIASKVFSILCNSMDKKEGTVLLELCRSFMADLLESSDHFRVAYIEHEFGNVKVALKHYLIYLEDNETASKAVVGNITNLITSKAQPPDLVALRAAICNTLKVGSKHESVLNDFLQSIDQRSMKAKENDQFERTALNRWPKLTAPARQLLGVLNTIDSYSNLAELANYANMEEKWVRIHLEKLKETGMIIDTGGQYRINSYVKPLIEQENKHSIVGRIVRGKGGDHVYKQVFNSSREFTIYQIMVQLCPNHLVFPNCSLQSIMSFDRMKELVSSENFGYYLRASVDIVVVSSTTYLPMMAIELDSIWHDTDHQQEKDKQKDELFATANIPFLRLRPVGSPSEAVIRDQVTQHVDELVRSLRGDMPGYEQARKLIEDLSAMRIHPNEVADLDDVPF